MVLVGGGFWRRLNHEGSALMIGIGVLFKISREISGPFRYVRKHTEGTKYEPGRGPLFNYASTLISDLQHPEL